MTVVKSVVKLGLGKDKLGSSKSEEKSVCEMDHKEDIVDGNGNDDNGGNGKPRKSMFKEKLVVKALVLGLSARGVEAKEVESEKKPVECLLCHGPHRLRKCLRKSVIEGNDGSNKEPKKLGLSKGKSEAKRANRSEKK
ncbi:hypothetical protein Goshw_011132 [Gossypium schwendimanii]|uniref:Uncharacterized protein n=1 Tax=Gossypium schwendimanii TaxID=34291 RepID=A0A7J9MT05_GOSSC|nr:hypothetical protein [Gossypium schwendimanii]